MHVRENRTKAQNHLIDFVNRYKFNMWTIKDEPSKSIREKITVAPQFPYFYHILKYDLSTKQKRYTSGCTVLLAFSRIKYGEKSMPVVDLNYIRQNRAQWRHLSEELKNTMRESLIAFCEDGLAGKIIASNPKKDKLCGS